MLDDHLTLLDGTEVISVTEVTKITGNPGLLADLLEQVSPEAILQGRWYYSYADVRTFIEGAQRS